MPLLPTFVMLLSLALGVRCDVVVPPGTKCFFGAIPFVIVSVTSTVRDMDYSDCPDMCFGFVDKVCAPGPDICTTPSPTPAPSPTSAPTSSPAPFSTNADLNMKTDGACRLSSQQAVPYALAAILGLAQLI